MLSGGGGRGSGAARMDLTLLTLLAALSGVGMGGLALLLGRTGGGRAVSDLRQEYNAALKRLGEMEIEIAGLRIELGRQHEIITHQHQEAQGRDAHIAQLYTGLNTIPREWQARVLGTLTTARPPPVLHPPAAPRHLQAAAIRQLAIILSQPWMASRASRDTYLLAGLPVRFTGKISRSEAQESDLINILTHAYGYGPDTFRRVLDNAGIALNGAEAGATLARWCREWGFDPGSPLP